MCHITYLFLLLLQCLQYRCKLNNCLLRKKVNKKETEIKKLKERRKEGKLMIKYLLRSTFCCFSSHLSCFTSLSRASTLPSLCLRLRKSLTSVSNFPISVLRRHNSSLMSRFCCSSSADAQNNVTSRNRKVGETDILMTSTQVFVCLRDKEHSVYIFYSKPMI